MTATNLIEFFKVLPMEEQKKFVELAEKHIVVNTPKLPKLKTKVLTVEEATKYLVTKIFK